MNFVRTWGGLSEVQSGASWFKLALSRFLLPVCFVVFGAVEAGAAASPAWSHLRNAPVEKARTSRWVQPLRGEMFRLDPASLQQQLAKAPKGEPWQAVIRGGDFQLPMPDGTLARFKIVETSIMEPGLAAQFPDIKTYAGQGVDEPQATLRMDFSSSGFHAQVFSPGGVVYVDPAYRGDTKHHVSYFQRDHFSPDGWQCLTEADAKPGKGKAGAGSDSGMALNKVQSGATLRTFRLAVACTGEYAVYHGGTASNAMSAIVTAVNRIDGIYENELAVRLTLIASNNLILFTNAATDPYTSPSNLNQMLTENQTTLSNVIGIANFDIGHVFGTWSSGGSGLASLAKVCSAGYKAQGASTAAAPTGDSFYLGIIAHEMGHQFGANHTFNSESASCGSGNRNATTAFEPGSGSTIMSYASACGSSNNLQSLKDAYFHAGSLDEMQTFLNGSGSGCAVPTATGNTAPTVSVGPNCAIPASTPFALTATGSDPNGDSLTYCWEEMDLGPANNLIDLDNGSSPLFRTVAPTNNPTRYFPKLSSVLANTNWNQEKLPTTTRTMNFRVTVRDNRAGGGGVADADIQVTSVSSAGPFVVTSPNTAVSWSGQRTVTWNVAGTTNAPINTSGVDIWLSTNSGNAFNILLGTNVPNTGSATVILPNLASSTARIKVQGNGNIFYDVSDVNFTISAGTAQPLVQLGGVGIASESCVPGNNVLDPYEPATLNWTLVNVGSGPTTNLVATLFATNGIYLPSNGVYVASMDQNYGAIPAGGAVTRQFSIAPVGTCGGSVTGLVQLADGAANMGTNSQKLNLGLIQTLVSTQVFNVASLISIPAGGNATPYPSSNLVSGVAGTLQKVTCALTGFQHTYPNDVDVLLVAPGSQTVMLMGAAGFTNPVSGVNLVFDDAAASEVSFNELPSGTYRPKDYRGDTMPSPAPSGPYGTTLTPLAATPNGIWKLYVQDVFAPDSGAIANGWKLTFITSAVATNCCNTYPPPTLTSTTYSNNVVQFGWNSLPGPRYQVQFRTNLMSGSWSNLGSSILGTNTFMSITDSASNSPTRFYRVVVGP